MNRRAEKIKSISGKIVENAKGVDPAVVDTKPRAAEHDSFAVRPVLVRAASCGPREEGQVNARQKVSVGLAVLSASIIGAAQAHKFSDWSPPVSLGAVVNSADGEAGSAISKDGLSFYFNSNRPGGLGLIDIYVSRRASIHDPWGPPQNLGPVYLLGPDHIE